MTDDSAHEGHGSPSPGGTPPRRGDGRDAEWRGRLARSEAAAASGSWELDLTDGRVTWSDGLYRLLGLDPRRCGDPAAALRDRVHPGDAPILRAARASASRGEDFSLEIRVSRADGSTRLLSGNGGPLPGPAGTPRRMAGVFVDVTDRRRAEEEARGAQARLDAVLESTSDCVLVLDREWRVAYMNGRCRRFVEGRRGLAVGTRFWEAYPEYVGSDFDVRYREAVSTGVPARFEAYLHHQAAWLDVGAFPSESGLSIFFRNVTDQRRNRERLVHLAHHDALTGLANRALFEADLARSLGDGAATVILVDLDGFKGINDTLGHQAGDALLREAAARLGDAVGGRGTLARLGGDEFALVTPGRGRRDADARGREIVGCFRSPFALDGREVRVAASVGSAVSGTDGEDAQGLVRAADVALYRAKADGGGAVRAFRPEMLDRERPDA